MQTKRKVARLSVLFALAVLVPLLGLAGAARAELPERKSPLADAPAVRHRHELRSLRFEIGPGVTTTIGQDFYHAVMVGGKASFFLSDWLAISGMFGAQPDHGHEDLLPHAAGGGARRPAHGQRSRAHAGRGRSRA